MNWFFISLIIYVILHILFALIVYFGYHCIQVYKYLYWHENHVNEIIERCKLKKQNGIKTCLKYSYKEMVSDEQFKSNMSYFEKERDEKGGFYFLSGRIMDIFGESCLCLGGARAALLQIAHPMVARSHKNIINNNDDNSTNFNMLSKALKSRFNGTFTNLFPIIYGPLSLSLAAAKNTWTVHKTTNGYIQSKDDTEIIGDGTIFNKDTYYSATMVMTLRWVWSTLIEGSIFIQQMMGYLPYGQTLAEAEDVDKEFFEENFKASVNIAMAFGLSKEQIPSTFEEFEEFIYYDMMESEHIVISQDCSKWVKVFFMAPWYSKPTNYILKSYTSLMFPVSVRNKFNKYDPSLLPIDNWSYYTGLLCLGLTRGFYVLTPKSIRWFNDYLRLQERVNGKVSWPQKIMQIWSGWVLVYLLKPFIEG